MNLNKHNKADLTDYIESLNIEESNEEKEKRDYTLTVINGFVKEWVLKIAKRLKIPGEVNECYGASVKIFGSQHLGVVLKDSDMDVVAILPSFISRKSFFEDFYLQLKEKDEITNLRTVAGARVPIISFVFQGFHFDMCTVIYPLCDLPPDLNYNDYGHLKLMDQTDIYSFNGIRETDAILQILPNYCVFRKLLLSIKLWAKRRCLYGTSVGLLGGISWTLLVANICRKHPYHELEEILERFFKVYSSWVWPQPILLKELERDTHGLKPFNMQQLNSTTHPHHMPIITPSYPEKNSSFTVLPCLTTLFKEQMVLGHKVLLKIKEHKATFEDLFEAFPFFKAYKHYLVVKAIANSGENSMNWFGLVEAKLRVFMTSLCDTQCILLVHPHAERKERQLSSGISEGYWFIGIRFHAGGIALNISDKVTSFKTVLKSLATGEDRNFWSDEMAIDIKHMKRSAINEMLASLKNG